MVQFFKDLPRRLCHWGRSARSVQLVCCWCKLALLESIGYPCNFLIKSKKNKTARLKVDELLHGITCESKNICVFWWLMMLGKGLFDTWDLTGCVLVQSTAVLMVLNQKWLAALDVDTVTKHQPPASARRPLSKYVKYTNVYMHCTCMYLYRSISVYIYIYIYTHMNTNEYICQFAVVHCNSITHDSACLCVCRNLILILFLLPHFSQRLKNPGLSFLRSIRNVWTSIQDTKSQTCRSQENSHERKTAGASGYLFPRPLRWHLVRPSEAAGEAGETTAWQRFIFQCRIHQWRLLGRVLWENHRKTKENAGLHGI